MKRDVKLLGIMLDCSRNAVMNVETLKRFIDVMSVMGYNSLQLYTEDTYEIEGERYFGYMRGKYSATELKEIDKYCAEKGMELIPCIQTLAHLGSIFRWGEYSKINDINDILLVDDEKTYQFLDRAFSTLRKAFSSKRINIGMDEAGYLGRGKYLDNNGYSPRMEILVRHLERVCEIAEKYGFRPMMWSDMFINNSACKPNHEDRLENIDSVDRKSLMDRVDLVYWDYYSLDKETYSKKIDEHKKLTNNIVFAGGFWSWNGFAPFNSFSIQATTAALSAMEEGGINNVFFTMWGDHGKECSYFALLPAMYYAANVYRGIKDVDEIKESFKKTFGSSFDDFILLDLPNAVCEGLTTENPCKYMLFSDLFLGMYDSTVESGVGLKYEQYSKALKNAGRSVGEYSYIFECMAALCDVLSIKYELGIKIRYAYQSGNMEKLKETVLECDALIVQIDNFYNKFRYLWEKENKPYGFEVHDLRLGGLIKRIENCRRRIQLFVEKKISKIDELEERLLDVTEKETLQKRPINNNVWYLTVSPNVV